MGSVRIGSQLPHSFKERDKVPQQTPKERKAYGRRP